MTEAAATAETAASAAAGRVAAALSSGSARRRRWALDRLRAGLDETEGPDLSPRLPYPPPLRAALAARLEALAAGSAGAGGASDAGDDDDDDAAGGDAAGAAGERAARAVADEAIDLASACSEGGVREAVPTIERLLASMKEPAVHVIAVLAHVLARLGARGQAPADAVRAAVADVVSRLERGAAAERPRQVVEAIAAVRRSLEQGVLPSLLVIEGARHVPAAFAAVVDTLAREGGAAEASLADFAPLLDGIHEAAGLRGAVGTIALILDAGEAPPQLDRAVPADALLHARKRSTPKLLRVAVHALRPLAAEGGPAAGWTREALPDAQDPLAGARAIAHEALRLRLAIESIRGERARLMAVLLLAARAKLLHALPSSIDDAVTARRGAERLARPPRDRVESPAEARAHVASALAIILDRERALGPSFADARRVVTGLGDAALPALLERLDQAAARAPLGGLYGDAGELVNLLARVGTRGAADALLARFPRLWRVDRGALLDAALTLADARFLAPILAERRPLEPHVDRVAAALAELTGADDPALAAVRDAVRARLDARVETGAFPGSTGAALAALREGERATLDLDLACEACRGTYCYPVTQALLVSDHAAAPEPRRARPAGGLKRVRLPDQDPDDLLVALDDLACKGCGARDRLRATEDALVTAEHLLSSIQEEIDGDLADVDPDACPVREGLAADLLSEEEWPLDTPLDVGKLRAKFRERLAAFRADKEGDSEARWPPELDRAWPGEPEDRD